MRRDHRAFLWDARRAAEAIADFTRGKSYEAFARDLLLARPSSVSSKSSAKR
jgi:uncharacterized protein with HEPN domain